MKIYQAKFQITQYTMQQQKHKGEFKIRNPHRKRTNKHIRHQCEALDGSPWSTSQSKLCPMTSCRVCPIVDHIDPNYPQT